MDENSPSSKQVTSAQGEENSPVPAADDHHEVGIVREEVQEMFLALSQQNPIADKITSEHISKKLENDALRITTDSRLINVGRLYTFGIIVIVFVFVLILVIVLKDDKDNLHDIVEFLVGLAAGGIGGFGIGKSKKDD